MEKREQDRNEIAKHFDVHPRTVMRWIRAGCPATKKRGAKRNPHRLDIDEVFNWLKEHGRTTLPGRPPDSEPGGPLGLAKLELTIAQARIAEMKRGVMEGSLHDIEECRARTLRGIYEAKQALLAMPRSLPGELIGRTCDEIRAILHNRFEQILARFSAAMIDDGNRNSKRDKIDNG